MDEIANYFGVSIDDLQWWAGGLLYAVILIGIIIIVVLIGEDKIPGSPRIRKVIRGAYVGLMYSFALASLLAIIIVVIAVSQGDLPPEVIRVLR